MIASGIDEKYWPEALMCSSFLVNRVINSHNVIPAEAWYSRKVDFSRFRTFGCNAFLFVPKEKRKHKLGERSKSYVFVGYDWNGYRLLDTENQKVVIGRDVKFKENSVRLMGLDAGEDEYDLLRSVEPASSDNNEIDLENSTWLAYFISGENVPATYKEEHRS